MGQIIMKTSVLSRFVLLFIQDAVNVHIAVVIALPTTPVLSTFLRVETWRVAGLRQGKSRHCVEMWHMAEQKSGNDTVFTRLSVKLSSSKRKA